MLTGTADISEIEQDLSAGAAPTPKPNTATIDDIDIESVKTPKELVRRYATDAGIDPDLVHRLATQESGYNQKAISPKGAIGVMQLMPGTARRLGVDPHDLHQNIQGGIAELKRLMDKYSDTRKALAAYNAGEGAVDKYNGIPPYAETKNYVDVIAGPAQKGTATIDQIDSQTPSTGTATVDQIGTGAAPTVNVGAPGRGVKPNVPASIPSYQVLTPESIDRQLNKPRYYESQLSPQAELAQRNQIADWQQWQKEHGQRLVELEAKAKESQAAAATPHGFETQKMLTPIEARELASLRQGDTEAREAYQKQIAPQRQDDLISVGTAKWPANEAALSAFVQKHGPLTREEQKLLGLPTNYLTQLSINAASGLAQFGLGTAAGFERFVGSPANARDLGQRSKQITTTEGVFGNPEIPGAVAHSVGGLAAPIALSAALPGIAPELAATGIIDPAIFFGTSALEHYGQGASGEESIKAGFESLLPIAGAKFIGKLAVGGPILQMAQRIGGNGFANGLYTAANNGDDKAIATSTILGMFMGIGGHENIPDDVIRKVVVDPDVQSTVTDVLAKPKLFERAYPKLEVKLKEAGLSDEQAAQFTDNLKSASAEPSGVTEDTGKVSTTPESLAKGSQDKGESQVLEPPSRVGQPVVHPNEDIHGRPIVAETESGKVVVANENNKSGVSVVTDRTPINEFEAPKPVDVNLTENKSILEAVRALGRIKVEDATVEAGELRQFGNKESKGQGLIGPNGKYTPDQMREALEEAGFHDPDTPGSLSLDGMYRLMDQEQRGAKVYGSQRDSNLVDRDLAAEYEQHAESQQRTKQFEHEQFIESEWADPDGPLSRAFDDVASGTDPNGDAFRYVAEKYGISPDAIEEHIQRATRVSQGQDTAAHIPGIGDGSGEKTTEGEGHLTGIKKAVTTAERVERGLSPVETAVRLKNPELFDKVKTQIDSGEMDIRRLTQEWADNPKNLSPEETFALLIDRRRLWNEKDGVLDSIEQAQAGGDSTAEIALRTQLADIDKALDVSERASVRTGTPWSDVGNIRQLLMAEDFTWARVKRQIESKGPASEKAVAEIKELTERLATKEREYNRDLAKRDEIISQLEAQRWAKSEARREAASGRKVKRAGSLDKISKEWESQKDQLVRLLKLQGPGGPDEPTGGSNLPYSPERGAVDPNLVTLPADVAKLLIDMARNRIRAGYTDAVEIIDSIHDTIKDKFEITKRQISDAVSGYGKQSKLSTDPVEVKLREVKRIRRLMSALEDAQKGEAPQRSGLKRDKPTQLVRELTRQLNDALRKNGFKLEAADRSPEEQYQTALDGIKTRLRNQIEDLDKQIKTGVKPEGKTPIPLDEEAQGLRAERDAKKAILEQLEGPRVTTDEQRAVARKNALRKQIDVLDRRAGGEAVPEKPSRTENYDKETVDLMYQRDALKRQLSDPTAKNKETVRARLIEAERKLREGDLNRETTFPSSIYDDAETKGLKNQLNVTNKRIADARALPEKIANLEAQKAETVRRLRERDFSKPESPNAPARPVGPEIAKRQVELKDLNKQLAAAKAEQNQVEAIQKRNAELRRRIREKDFTPTAKAPAKPVSSRVVAERETRAKLQKEYDSIKPVTEAERNAATERALEKSIADNESRVANKQLMPDGKPEPANSPRIETLRKRNEETKKILDDLRKNDPEYLAAKQVADLKTYNKVLDKQEVDLNKKMEEIKAGTYKKPEPAQPRPLDNATLKRKAEIEKTRREIKQKLFELDDTKLAKAGRFITGVFGALKSAKATLDISAPGRQGRVLVAAMPRMSLAAFAKQFRAMSEVGQLKVYNEIENNPAFELAQKSGVEFTGDPLRKNNMGASEEVFSGHMLEKIPILGRGVAASERAYSAFLDWQRVNAFGRFAEDLKNSGIDHVKNPETYQQMAKFVNYATGRGNLGEGAKGKMAAEVLNLPFFAPKYRASRFQMLYSAVNPNNPKAVRMAAAKTLFVYYGAAATALTLASVLGKRAGFKVGTDPDDSDFGKLVWGDTRYDLFGGQLQDARLVWGLARGMSNAVRGIDNEPKKKPLNVLSRYLETGAAPIVSLSLALSRGKTFTGDKFTPGVAVRETIVPMVAADLFEGYKVSGAAGVLKALPTAAGIGVQTYKKLTPEELKDKKKADALDKKANPDVEKMIERSMKRKGLSP